MDVWNSLKARWNKSDEPEHLRLGKLGERAAKRHLCRSGMKFLTANFRSPRGEIDLVFRDHDCLVFVEVKTRSSEHWTRPAAAVTAHKRRLHDRERSRSGSGAVRRGAPEERNGASQGEGSRRDVESQNDHGRSLWPTAKRLRRVPSMFDSLGVQVPCTT